MALYVDRRADLLMAERYLRAGFFGDADARDKRLHDARNSHALARCLDAQGRPVEALREVDAGLRMSSDDEVLRQLGGVLKSAIAEHP